MTEEEVWLLPVRPPSLHQISPCPTLSHAHVCLRLLSRRSHERHHRNHVWESVYGRAGETAAAVLPQDAEDGADARGPRLHHEAEPGQHGPGRYTSTLARPRSRADPPLLSVQLYELMIMAFKYQVFVCPRPKDLLLISYNHMDAIRELARDTPAVVNHVDETHRRMVEVCDPPFPPVAVRLRLQEVKIKPSGKLSK